VKYEETIQFAEKRHLAGSTGVAVM